MKTFVLLLALASTIILSGCSKDEQPSTEAPPVKVVRVESLKVEPRDLTQEFTLPGSLAAWKDLNLAAEVAGPVEFVGVEEGERVTAGQDLVRIDSLTLQANYASAKADFVMRQKTEQRLKKLVADKLVSDQEYESALGALDVSSAVLRTAEIMLAKGTLHAPISGRLEQRYVEPGEFVGLGDPLVRVVQIDRLKVNVDMPEKDISYLHLGDQVTLEESEFNHQGSNLRGRVAHIGYVADPLTRTYPVQIEIDNSDESLRPGMIVRTRFVRRNFKQVLAVPLYAVIDRDGQKYLFVRSAEKVREQVVSLGEIMHGEVVVTKGLQAGEDVVIKGQQLLSDGARVRTGETL